MTFDLHHPNLAPYLCTHGVLCSSYLLICLMGACLALLNCFLLHIDSQVWLTAFISFLPRPLDPLKIP